MNTANLSVAQSDSTTEQTEKPIVRFRRVTKLYGTVIGINDVSVSLRPGAYGLLGPNGAGKSTFVNLLTGQLRPTTGRVELWGRDPWKSSDLLDRVGLCPTTDINLPTLGALDWVQYLLQLQGYSRTVARARATEELELIGLADAMNRPIGGYSKGMRQRAKLAQALAHDPKLLILDEPFNGLDPVGRHEMSNRLKAWCSEGNSLILASHILHEVEAVASSFLLILSGRILASGSTQEVRQLLAETPSELRVTCDRPQEFSAVLLNRGLASSVRILSSNEIALSVPTGLELFEALPKICEEGQFAIEKIQSPDDSLEALFSMLLRIHRGEAH